MCSHILLYFIMQIRPLERSLLKQSSDQRCCLFFLKIPHGLDMSQEQFRSLGLCLDGSLLLVISAAAFNVVGCPFPPKSTFLSWLLCVTLALISFYFAASSSPASGRLLHITSFCDDLPLRNTGWGVQGHTVTIPFPTPSVSHLLATWYSI